MAVDFDKGMRPNLYELMQDPGGELKPATAETLGGVKIGRGVNVEEDGTISVTAPAPVDTYTKEEIDEQQDAQNYNINSNTLAIERLETAIDDTYTQEEIDEQQGAQNSAINANTTDIAGIKQNIESIQAEQQTQNTNITVNANAINAHTQQINNIADYQDTQDANISANTTAINGHTTDIANNATAIANEAAARENMDSTLAANIAANVAAIAAEVANRENADSELSNALDALSTALETLSTTIATDSTLGLIKTNSAQFIETDENGVLQIGGRLGQFPETTGLFAPDDREPRAVGNYCLLITDVKGANMTNSRSFAVVSGLSITLKTAAAAGATEYHVSNTYANRLKCKILEGGFAAKDEAASTVETIPVVSVTIGGEAYTPDSSPDDPNNDIIITTESTLNPDDAITSIRAVGTMGAYSTAHIGNGISSVGGGRSLLLGSGITKDGSGNECGVVAQDTYVLSNGSAIYGRWHIVNKNRVFIAGQGHDTTNARADGVAAIGSYSVLEPKHVFVVGLGASHIARKNVFEVTAEHGGTARANFIDAKNGKLEFTSEEDIVPTVATGNWSIGNGGSIQDFGGTPGFATTDVRGRTVNITVATRYAMPVTPGEAITWSFMARKRTGDETGKLQLNLMKCNADGGETSNNVVKDGTAASYSTEWTAYSGTFTIPSGMEFILPRITRTNTGAGSAGGYDIKDITVIRQVDSGIILTSPNNTKYKVDVDNSGNIITTAL